MIKSLLFLISISYSVLSFSQYGEWIAIGKNKNVSYSIRSNDLNFGDVKKIWIKEVSKSFVSVSKTGKKILIPNGYSISLREFNCSTRQIKFISYTDYYSNGKVVISGRYEEYEQSWEDAIPDSIGEFLLESACEKF